MKIRRRSILSLILVMSLVVTTMNFVEVQSKEEEIMVNQPLNANKKVVLEISDLQIKDYSQYTGKYFIYFNGQEASKGYNVYIDSLEKSVKEIKSSGEYLTTDELTEFEAGTHTMYVTSIGDDKTESEPISSEFQLTGMQGDYNDIPQVYIYSSTDITKTYHDRADVVISIVDRDGGSNKDIIDSGSNIKIRGNTTASAAKKPWNFKLGSKEKVLGMDKGKKWCLLSNPYDKSLMRNKVALDLGTEVGLAYTSQCRYVEVYLNGSFQGNYLMTEPVEAKSGRVEIDAYEADNMDILLELGTRNEPDVDHFTTSVLKTTFDVNDPEKDDDLANELVDAKISKVKEYLDNFENALVGQNYNEILNYIDEESFVDFYIVNEFLKNGDFDFSSTRFYIKDNKIYAGPLWDFDLSSGNVSSSFSPKYYTDGVSYKGYYCQGMNWYSQLIKNANFYDKVKERYKGLQYIIQNIYKKDSERTLSINSILNIYGDSLERNYRSTDELGAGWDVTKDDEPYDFMSYTKQAGWTTCQQPIEHLRDWLEKRNQWLCEQWEIDMDLAYREGELPTREPVTQETTKTPNIENPTTLLIEGETTETFTTMPYIDKAGKTKVKLANKKKSVKKAKVSLKKISGAKGYQIQISATKKFKKVLVNKFVKKAKFNISSKKIKNKKKLYIRARAYKSQGKKKLYGEWSIVKKIKILK